MKIGAHVVGDTEVVQEFSGLQDRIKAELRVGIGRVALKLQREVVQNKLSGQVLKVRTGTLRRSIDQSVTEDGSIISGVVSSNLKYAAFHEYGFHGTETVREHLRRSKAQFALAKFTKKGRETAASKRQFAGTGEITVRAHERKVDLPERSFLRSALRDLESQGVFSEEIDAALARAVK